VSNDVIARTIAVSEKSMFIQRALIDCATKTRENEPVAGETVADRVRVLENQSNWRATKTK